MAFSLPNPTDPTNGQPLDATPVLENIVALAQAIQAFDGSQITSKSVLEAALADAINPRLRDDDLVFDHVNSGCVWTADSAGASLNGSMTGGTVYINGYRVLLSAIVAHPFTASKDTYVDVDYLGNVLYSEVTTNAASPSLAINSVRLAIIVTGASIAAAASINQGQEDRVIPIASSTPYCVSDSLGNLICPRDPSRRLLGYARLTGPFTTTTVSLAADVTGLATTVNIPTGRKIKVRFAPTLKTTASAATAMSAYVREGSTIIAEDTINEPTTQYNVKTLAEQFITPTAGVHTYKASVDQNGAGTLTVQAGTGGGASYMAIELFIELE